MKIFKNLPLNKNYQNSVIAIGNFDGIHIGHKKVLSLALKRAKRIRNDIY